MPNRQRCIDTAERLFADAAVAQHKVAVIYADLNSFKRVNDTFGHSVGDAVLRNVADKLARVLAPFQAAHDSVSVARFGGDEFVVLIGHSEAPAIAREIAAACSSMLNDPIVHDGLEFYSAPEHRHRVYTRTTGPMSRRCSSTRTPRCIRPRPALPARW